MKVTFEWNMDVNEQGYRIQLSESADFSSFIFDTVVPFPKCVYNKKYRLQVANDDSFSNVLSNTLLNQKYELEIKDLKNYTNYSWRVRNESGDTLGYWSDTWQFKTAMSPIGLVYPENTQTGLEQEINFKWYPVIGAEYYQLQISKNDNFTDLVYSKDSITTTEKNVPALEMDLLYYWRVRVWNTESIGTAFWSEVWTFRTGNSSVSDEAAGVSIVPNPAGDFITIKLGAFNPNTCQTTPTLKRGVDEVIIYNTLGERVMTVEQTPSSVQQINISDLPRGMYFVKVGGETAKFFKM